MNESPELVHLSVERDVATLTLDSPANRNALSRQLVAELNQGLIAANASDEVRVIVLTHTGGTFCAGADLREAVTDGMERGTRALLALLRNVVGLLETWSWPSSAGMCVRAASDCSAPATWPWSAKSRRTASPRSSLA